MTQDQALCYVGMGMYLAVNIQVFIVAIIRPLAPPEYQMPYQFSQDIK